MEVQTKVVTFCEEKAQTRFGILRSKSNQVHRLRFISLLTLLFYLFCNQRAHPLHVNLCHFHTMSCLELCGKKRRFLSYACKNKSFGWSFPPQIIGRISICQISQVSLTCRWFYKQTAYVEFSNSFCKGKKLCKFILNIFFLLNSHQLSSTTLSYTRCNYWESNCWAVYRRQRFMRD